MSFEESDDAISATWSAGHDVDGDFSQSQQHEMVNAHHQRPHISVDELLKVLQEVLQKPAATATNVPAAEKKKMCSAKKHMSAENEDIPDVKNHKNFRNWLLLLTSLVATITFAAGLTPPGGFWAEDNIANGYVAGTSVMRDKFRTRYLVFYYSNTAAFFSSLVVIGMLANSTYSDDNQTVVTKGPVLVILVAACFVSLGTAYITGTWDTSKESKEGIYTIIMFAVVLVYMSMHWIKYAIDKIKNHNKKKESKADPACLA